MSANASFQGQEHSSYQPFTKWPALVVTAETIEEEVARLADVDLRGPGRRLSRIVHPCATAPGLGFAPGIDVSLNVLRPGEKSRPLLTNANYVGFCIRGEGTFSSGLSTLPIRKWSTWNVPSMRPFGYHNMGQELLVYLTYSNIPLLEKLHIHFFDDDAEMQRKGAKVSPTESRAVRSRDLSLNQTVGDLGARILGYEYTVDIDAEPLEAMVWHWEDVASALGIVMNLSNKYEGRRVGMLNNPGTGRRVGTSNSFFAALGQSGPSKTAILHRHSSAAINYYFGGSGHSRVDDQNMEWKEGDLQFSAPSWAAHGHGMGPDGARSLTIQDHPFHIGNDSLIWQERLDGPIMHLGGDVGVQTNLPDVLVKESTITEPA